MEDSIILYPHLWDELFIYVWVVYMNDKPRINHLPMAFPGALQHFCTTQALNRARPERSIRAHKER